MGKTHIHDMKTVSGGFDMKFFYVGQTYHPPNVPTQVTIAAPQLLASDTFMNGSGSSSTCSQGNLVYTRSSTDTVIKEKTFMVKKASSKRKHSNKKSSRKRSRRSSSSHHKKPTELVDDVYHTRQGEPYLSGSGAATNIQVANTVPVLFGILPRGSPLGLVVSFFVRDLNINNTNRIGWSGGGSIAIKAQKPCLAQIGSTIPSLVPTPDVNAEASMYITDVTVNDVNNNVNAYNLKKVTVTFVGYLDQLFDPIAAKEILQDTEFVDIQFNFAIKEIDRFEQQSGNHQGGRAGAFNNLLDATIGADDRRHRHSDRRHH